MTAIKTLLWSIFVPGTVTTLVPYLLLSSRFDSFRINLSDFRFFGLIPILIGVMIDKMVSRWLPGLPRRIGTKTA